jgi:hypothetical protein
VVDPRRRLRELPPLVSTVVVLLVLLTVLPSALNRPANDPPQAAEYAPVPPDGDAAPAAGGNLSSLGLAGTGALGGDLGAGDQSVEVGGVSRKAPSTKRCVGNPPRQTEDPLSPPCVAHFAGDNFGSTYTGVTGAEVRVLFYVGGDSYVTSTGTQSEPPNVYRDLAEPPRDDDTMMVRILRNWQRFFNDRYQTYGRFVHFFMYTSDESTPTPEARRADAAQNFASIKPFAVVTALPAGNEVPYIETLAGRGVLNFGSLGGRQASFFAAHPKLLWGYPPSVEQQAHHFSSFLCTQVVPHPTSFSGNEGDNGRPRKFGLLSTTDETKPGLQRLRELVEREVEQCGGRFVARASFPSAGNIIVPVNEAATSRSAATQAMAQFRDAGVTTIIWPGGYETLNSSAAASISYRPEWIVAGDGWHDGGLSSQQQDQSVWQNAVSRSPMTRLGKNQVGEPGKNPFPAVQPIGRAWGRETG